LVSQARSNVVFRAGADNFYDLGNSPITNAMISFPYIQEKLIFGTSFPLSASAAAAPPFTTSPPAAVMSVIDPNHVLPRTYGWNAAIEHSMSRSDVLTHTCIGAGGRKLMRKDIHIAPNPSFTGEFDVLRKFVADYNRLQKICSASALSAMNEWLATTTSCSGKAACCRFVSNSAASASRRQSAALSGPRRPRLNLLRRHPP
jgi:hypothetical protein